MIISGNNLYHIITEIFLPSIKSVCHKSKIFEYNINIFILIYKNQIIKINIKTVHVTFSSSTGTSGMRGVLKKNKQFLVM